jgi:hypothetical protein
MAVDDPADGAFQQGEPPYRPGRPAAPASTVNRRLLGAAIGFAVGCIFSGCTATTQIPESTGAGVRCLVFFGMLLGPLCPYVVLGPTDLSYSPIAIWQLLGFLSVLPISAYPVKPSALTACVSVVGLGFWFWAGFISVIYCFYAG